MTQNLIIECGKWYKCELVATQPNSKETMRLNLEELYQAFVNRMKAESARGES